MTLKIAELFGIQASLKSLSSYQQVIEGKPLLTPFNLSGKTRWNVSKNLRICEDKLAPWPKVLEGLKEELKVTPETKNDDPSFKSFFEQATKLSEEQEEECSFLKLPLSELISDNNPVSAEVLGVLSKFDLIDENA